MKITRIEPIPVLVPLKKGLTAKTAHGEHVDSAYVMVKVHTDDGIVGIGEATLSPRWSGEISPGCVAVIDELLSPALTGMDPRDVGGCVIRIDRAIKLNPFAKGAVVRRAAHRH